jgi:hypothetical protein
MHEARGWLGSRNGSMGRGSGPTGWVGGGGGGRGAGGKLQGKCGRGGEGVERRLRWPFLTVRGSKNQARKR